MAEELTTPTPSPEPAPVETQEPVVEAVTQEPEPPVVADAPIETSDDSESTPNERVVPQPDQYVLPEGMPDELRQFAFDNEMTQKQLDGTMNKFAQYVTGMDQAKLSSLKLAGQAHIKNWGEHGKENVALIEQALVQNDPTGALTKALNESGYNYHPAVLNFLFQIGRSMQEGGYLKSAVHIPAGQKTVAQTLYGDSHPSKEN